MVENLVAMIRVSVIVPCYNRETLLSATLESLSAQTLSNWECIVVDDGSGDKSFEVARQFAQKDIRFRVTRRQGTRRGANVCRNQGLNLAVGEYAIFLDSDDLLSPTCLDHRVTAMDANPECGYGVFLTELFQEQVGDRKVLWNIYTETNDLARFLSKDPVWHTTGPIWSRTVVATLGGFDEDLLSFQDWDIHVRGLAAGIKYFKDPVRDHFYRNRYSGSTAISAVSTVRADHLRSHELLFGNTVRLLSAAGLLDEDNRCRLAGLFWWLAKSWLNGGRVVEATGVWRNAWEFGLCNRRQLFEGRLMLRMYSLRGMSRLANLMQHSWPPQFYRTGSEHLHNSPLNLLRPAASSADDVQRTIQNCVPKLDPSGLVSRN